MQLKQANFEKKHWGSIYCKPNFRRKADLHDHIAEAYNIISTKYTRGLHFIIAGDTNNLNISQIINLSPNLSLIVNKPKRVDKVT